MVCTCGFGVGLLGNALLVLGFWTDVSEVSKSFLRIFCGQLVRYLSRLGFCAGWFLPWAGTGGLRRVLVLFSWQCFLLHSAASYYWIVYYDCSHVFFRCFNGLYCASLCKFYRIVICIRISWVALVCLHGRPLSSPGLGLLLASDCGE